MTKVAIITRTKDRPVFLSRALKSVQDQTYTDYKHYIVNDAGDKALVDDAVVSLNEEQQSKTEVIHRSQPSGGPDTMFTESVDAAKSEYVVLHDDDDTWHPDFLKYAVEHLDANKDLGGVVVRADKVIEEVTEGGLKELKRAHYMPDMKEVSLYRQCIDNQLTPIAFLYRRDAYEAVGKYDSSFPVCGDWEFGIRLLMKYDVDFIDPGFALAYYHHRKQANTARGDNSFAKHNHRYYTNKIINSYLRADLRRGNLGLGYIMGSLVYSRENTATMIKKVLPKFLVNLLKRKA